MSEEVEIKFNYKNTIGELTEVNKQIPIENFNIRCSLEGGELNILIDEFKLFLISIGFTEETVNECIKEF